MLGRRRHGFQSCALRISYLHGAPGNADLDTHRQQLLVMAMRSFPLCRGRSRVTLLITVSDRHELGHKAPLQNNMRLQSGVQVARDGRSDIGEIRSAAPSCARTFRHRRRNHARPIYEPRTALSRMLRKATSGLPKSRSNAALKAAISSSCKTAPGGHAKVLPIGHSR